MLATTSIACCRLKFTSYLTVCNNCYHRTLIRLSGELGWMGITSSRHTEHSTTLTASLATRNTHTTLLKVKVHPSPLSLPFSFFLPSLIIIQITRRPSILDLVFMDQLPLCSECGYRPRDEGEEYRGLVKPGTYDSLKNHSLLTTA